MSQQTPKTAASDPRALMSDTEARTLLGISTMSAFRWQRDPMVGWPKVAAIVRGRKYFFRTSKR